MLLLDLITMKASSHLVSNQIIPHMMHRESSYACIHASTVGHTHRWGCMSWAPGRAGSSRSIW